METVDKIDLKTFIGDLEKKVEPKTLEECLKEAGGWPFTAKAIAGGRSREAWPTGIELRFIGEIDWCGGWVPSNYSRNPNRKDDQQHSVEANFPRWQLLGHKT